MSTPGVIREGFAGLARAKLAAAGSVITIAVALVLLGLFSVVSTNTSRMLREMRDRLELEAFLDESVSRQGADEIGRKLLAVGGVDSVRFISKDEAAKIFRQEFGEDIGTVLDANPLPPSYRISLRDDWRTVSGADSVREAVSKIPGVEQAVYHRELLLFLEKKSTIIDKLGLAFGALLAISSIVLVANTIRLTMVRRYADSLRTQAYGTGWTGRRGPFIVEGILQGLCGGLLAAGVLYYGSTRLSALASPDLAEFIRIGGIVYVDVVVVGMLLGVFGSLLPAAPPPPPAAVPGATSP